MPSGRAQVRRRTPARSARRLRSGTRLPRSALSPWIPLHRCRLLNGRCCFMLGLVGERCRAPDKIRHLVAGGGESSALAVEKSCVDFSIMKFLILENAEKERHVRPHAKDREPAQGGAQLRDSQDARLRL